VTTALAGDQSGCLSCGVHAAGRAQHRSQP
jgi:hypothetical protein